MKRLLISFLCSFISITTFAQKLDGGKVLDMMYERYGGKWHKTLGVIKDVETYEYGRWKPGGTWMMAIELPGKYRMDIGDPATKTTVLLYKSKLYKMQQGKVIYEMEDYSNLLFLAGGMYFYPKQEFRHRFVGYDINYNMAFDTTFADKEVYVIGAANGKEWRTQIWVEKERLLLLRFLEFDAFGNVSEVRYEGHQKYGNSWIEDKVSYFQAGKPLQVEKYRGKPMVNIKFDPLLFQPKELYNARHWYYNKVIN